MNGEMMDCEAVLRKLWDFLDHELTPDRLQAVEAHMQECQHCMPHLVFRDVFRRAVVEARDEVGDTTALAERVRRALRAQVPAE